MYYFSKFKARNQLYLLNQKEERMRCIIIFIFDLYFSLFSLTINNMYMCLSQLICICVICKTTLNRDNNNR